MKSEQQYKDLAAVVEELVNLAESRAPQIAGRSFDIEGDASGQVLFILVAYGESASCWPR